MFVWCWASVVDSEPTLIQHYRGVGSFPSYGVQEVKFRKYGVSVALPGNFLKSAAEGGIRTPRTTPSLHIPAVFQFVVLAGSQQKQFPSSGHDDND